MTPVCSLGAAAGKVLVRGVRREMGISRLWHRGTAGALQYPYCVLGWHAGVSPPRAAAELSALSSGYILLFRGSLTVPTHWASPGNRELGCHAPRAPSQPSLTLTHCPTICNLFYIILLATDELNPPLLLCASSYLVSF